MSQKKTFKKKVFLYGDKEHCKTMYLLNYDLSFIHVLHFQKLRGIFFSLGILAASSDFFIGDIAVSPTFREAPTKEKINKLSSKYNL